VRYWPWAGRTAPPRGCFANLEAVRPLRQSIRKRALARAWRAKDLTKPSLQKDLRLTAKEFPMYSASFIYEPSGYDEEFHRLNDTINDIARSMPGFLGKEAWQSLDGQRHNATITGRIRMTCKPSLLILGTSKLNACTHVGTRAITSSFPRLSGHTETGRSFI